MPLRVLFFVCKVTFHHWVSDIFRRMLYAFEIGGEAAIFSDDAIW